MATQPPTEQLYFAWLYSQVASVENRNLTRQYWKLLRIFFTEEFTWSHPRDANLAQQGIDLRTTFLRENENVSIDSDPSFLNDPCDMLELLVALAQKMSDHDLEEREPGYWFWEMMENLDLRTLNDAQFRPSDEAHIRRVIQRVIVRNYNSKGEGGLFPLQRPRKNQQREELFLQAEAYLVERL